jgi:hypothetical protein
MPPATWRDALAGLAVLIATIVLIALGTHLMACYVPGWNMANLFAHCRR